MNLQEIYDLIGHFSASPLSFLEVETDGTRVRLKKAGTPSSGPAAPGHATGAEKAEISEKDLIKAPLVGVFYAAPSPEAEPFVVPGGRVKKGQTVCLIEAMKMVNEVPAPRDGVVDAVLVKNEELVEFGAPLFRLREN